jgi:hypothetical protein
MVMDKNAANASAPMTGSSLAVGLLLLGTGTGLAVLGLRWGNSVAAQFLAQIGFAVFTAGLIDFVLVYGINRFREGVGRETRQALETIESLIAQNRRAQEIFSTAAKDLNRIQFEHDVLQGLTSLQTQVSQVRLSVDPSYVAETIKEALRSRKAADE